MKTKMNLNYLAMLLTISLLGLVSCDKKINDWPVDSSSNRLFKSLVFEQSGLTATGVQIRFTRVIGVKYYIFEFSNDSLTFNKIVRTERVQADTLSVYATSTVVNKVEYRTTFSDLDANALYSVRMRAVAVDSTLVSNYSQFSFRTPAENIFTGVTPEFDKATITWTPTNKVTALIITANTGRAIIGDTVLTATQISESKAMITGLSLGNYYTAVIKNGNKIRGSINFKTAGTAGSDVYEVKSTDNLSHILDSLNTLPTPKTRLTLVFDNAQSYNLATLIVPAGIASLTFTPKVAGTMPAVTLNKFSIASPMDGISFENISLSAEGSITNQLISTGQLLKVISFEGCKLFNYNCVVRLTTPTTDNTIDKININNCLVDSIGGYGVINVSSSNAMLHVTEINVSNCTFTKLATQLADIRVNAKISVSNSTFYNQYAKLSQILRLEKDFTGIYPTSATVKNCIFSGANGGTQLKATGFKPGTAGTPDVNFGTCYITSEVPINATYPFTDIVTYAGPASQLFTNAAGSVFSIKTGAGFAGTVITGDPRWYK